MKHKILLIMENVEELGYILDNIKDDFLLSTYTTAEGAREAIRRSQASLVLIDYHLPDMNGIDLCASLKKSEQTLPIMILSSDRTKESEIKALEAGAQDYISKPLNYKILKLRMENALNANLNQKNLKEMIQIRTHELEKIQNNMIHTVSLISEYRDPETNAHINRTKHYVLATAQKLRENSRYSTILTPNMIKTFFEVSPLHDIGKIIIPDAVLLKPGAYTDEERRVMEKHTTYGAFIIEQIEKGIEDNFYLEIAQKLVHFHHERWDGTGYPEGLKGVEIPLCARIMAIADMFDALISTKSYRDPLTIEDAFSEIKMLSGKAFDPDVVEAFLSVKEIIEKIVHKFSDASGEQSQFEIDLKFSL